MLSQLLSGILSRGHSRGPGVKLPEQPGPAAQLVAAGEARRGAGDLQAAEALYKEALVLDPSLLHCWQLLGIVYAESGRPNEAVRCFERASEIDPVSAAVLCDLGQAQRLNRDYSHSLASYRRALALEPDLSAAQAGLAQVLELTGEREDAAAAYLEALRLPPFDPAMLARAVDLLDRLDRHAQARALCETVIAQEPGNAQAHASLGVLLVKRDFEPAAGLHHLEAALEQRSGDPALHVTRSIALRDLARTDEAIDACDHALSLDPGNPMARFHRALALLLTGDFGRAWPDYEARLLSETAPKRSVVLPRWHGEDLSGKTILVHAEQGIGDQIMFASCVRDLAQRAGQVVLECAPKLRPLFKRSFPDISVTTERNGEEVFWQHGGADYEVPIGSLPLHFRRDRRSFGEGRPYLCAEPRWITDYRQRIAALGPGVAVGLSWRGGTIDSRRPLRSLDPGLLFPRLNLPGIQWISVQYDATAAEVEELGRRYGLRIQHWQDAIDDYDRTAALLGAVDRVISVCTSVVHLAGALGRPVSVAAPRCPEWRYGIHGDSLPWYGSAHVFRQQTAGEWSAVIERIVSVLQ